MTTTTQHTPISKGERIFELDIIRGFALIGVLLVNIFTFNTTFFHEVFATTALTDPMGVDGGINKIVSLFVELFANGKFYTIFSFLFGMGFFIFMERAEAKGLSPKKLFARRLFFLFIFGILHFTFIWWGDILHVYALVAIPLMFFKNRQLKTIKRWIIALLVISTVLSFGFTLLNDLSQVVMGPEAYESYQLSSEALVEESLFIYQHASLLDTIAFRVQSEASYRVFGLIVNIPKILGMFLIGLYVGKLGVFKNLEKHMDSIKKAWKVTGVIGGLSTLVYALILLAVVPVAPMFNAATKIVFKEIATVFLSMFYVTTLIQLYRKEGVKHYLAPMRYIGQMALTNYLMQCFICSLIFYGHGLGLIGKAETLVCMILTISIYGIQLILSKKWLEKYTYGPCEWIWRRLTYGNLA